MIFAILAPMSIYVQLPALIVIISLVYSATRYEEWDSIFTEAFRWGMRMAGFLVSIGIVLYLVDIWL